MYVVIKNNKSTTVGNNIICSLGAFDMMAPGEMGLLDKLTKLLEDRNPNKNETHTFVKVEVVYEPLKSMVNGVREISHYELVFHVSTNDGFSFNRIEKPFILKFVESL